MNKNSGCEGVRPSRRRVLKTISGLTALGFLGTGASNTAAADPGDQLWTFETDDPVRSSPTVVNSTVFFATDGGTVYAVDVTDSSELWTFQADGGIRSSPSVVDGTVYIGSGIEDEEPDDTHVYAISAESGREIWSFEAHDAVVSSPTIVDGTVYVASGLGRYLSDGIVYALNAEDGTEKWSFNVGRGAESSPTVVDDTVYMGGYSSVSQGAVYALDSNDGSLHWEFQTENDVVSSPTVVDETVFVGSSEHTFYALNRDGGTERWSADTDGPVISSPTVADGTVYVGSGNAYNADSVYAFDLTDGDLLWTSGTEREAFVSSPTVVDDHLYITAYRNPSRLYALDTTDGTELWSFATDGWNPSSPIVVDGTLFCGGEKGLFALDTGIPGSSEGSRVALGTENHHHDWVDEPEPNLEIERQVSESNHNERQLATVVGGGILSATTVLAAVAFLRSQRSQTDKQEQNLANGSSNESSSTSGEKPAQSPAPTQQSNDSSAVKERRSKAEKKRKTAVTARSINDFTAAADAYSEAITEYQAALSALQAGATEQRSEIEDAIESTRADLETVTTRRDQRNDVTNALQPAERNIQVAIIAFVNGHQTLARIRFRQARDTLSEAMEILDNSDVDVLSQPIEVNVEPDRALSSTTLRELPAISESAASALSDAGVETVSDLTSSDEAPWTPQEVTKLADEGKLSEKTVTKLTVLSWWHDSDYEFSSVEAVSSRKQQAEYGFKQAN